MSARKPCCQSINGWLKANLGKGCLAPLTGSDHAALEAAVHIADAMCYADSSQMPHLYRAFREVVLTMQEKCRYLAYHGIAHVRDWSDRMTTWQAAGLEFVIGMEMKCEGELK